MRKFSKEHRRRLSISATGRKLSPETIEKIRFLKRKENLSLATRKKMSLAGKKRVAEKNPNWGNIHARRDSKHWYTALHAWIRYRLGSAQKCSFCGKVRKEAIMCSHCKGVRVPAVRIEWANVSGKYKHDLSDWISLCKQCHLKYDRKL